MDDVKNNHHSLLQSGSKGSIIEVVEEALKWRLEANNKKQDEVIGELVELVNENKRHIVGLSGNQNTELSEVKNSIVEAVSDVLL